MLTITETPAPTDINDLLVEAIAAELSRQAKGDAVRAGDRMQLSGEVDLREMVFAIQHALTTSPDLAVS